MQKSFKEYFHIPDMNFSELRVMSEEEETRLYEEATNTQKKDWRKFVERVEAHPEMLSCWDMDISFDEFAARVRAGEYD